jgi:superfamily II DNA or RNA helicase
LIAFLDSYIKVKSNFYIERYCKTQLTLDNPEYLKKLRMGLWIGNTPKKIELFWKNQEYFCLPYGCRDDLINYVDDFKESFEEHNIKIECKKDLKLYDYQQKAVDEMVKKSYGILVSPAGSGKTQMAINIIKKLSLKTLWLTHTKDLLNQSKNRFKEYYKCGVGEIGNGKVNIQDVTFATIQTMCKLDIDSLKNEFSVIIVDECHRVAGTPSKVTMFSKVLNNLSAKHKIGLTATPHRSDGLIKSMYALLGDISYEVDKKHVENYTIKAKIRPIKTDFEISINSECVEYDGTVNFTKMITEISEDVSRNEFIINHLKQQPEVSILVLSDRINQLQYIQEKLERGKVIHGKTNKTLRENIIQDMKKGNEKILFASYALAKEGLDIPKLERLFLITPKSDKAVIIQSVGRIERKLVNKKQGVVYDFVDNVGVCIGMFNKRKRFYKMNNNEVEK